MNHDIGITSVLYTINITTFNNSNTVSSSKHRAQVRKNDNSSQ